MESEVRQPTEEEVIARLKDDGDFDTLRLKIIRKVKENEELRSNIITEVKQSMVLNEDGSEKLKLRQLSDAIYQEIGSKVMGEISEAVWKVIRSSENDIKGAVEAVYNRIVNPKIKKEEKPSPAKQLVANGIVHPATLTSFKGEVSAGDDNEPLEPPGFGQSNQNSTRNADEHREILHEDRKCTNGVWLNGPVLQLEDDDDDDLPPGFEPTSNGPSDEIMDEDPDVPPGFE